MPEERPAPGPIGSVAEETARLLDALLGPPAPDGSGVATAERRRDDSTPTPETEPEACPSCGHVPGPPHTAAVHDTEVCRVCPVCQLLRVVRSVQPETLDRLADLAAAVTETLREAAANRWREAGGGPRPDRPTVEDIVVADDTDGDTDDDTDEETSEVGGGR